MGADFTRKAPGRRPAIKLAVLAGIAAWIGLTVAARQSIMTSMIISIGMP